MGRKKSSYAGSEGKSLRRAWTSAASSSEGRKSKGAVPIADRLLRRDRLPSAGVFLIGRYKTAGHVVLDRIRVVSPMSKERSAGSSSGIPTMWQP